MLTVFILAFIVGIGMMGMVFVPQFAENVLKIKAGTGGYLITFLAFFSGISAPLSGKLLDKKGARFVLSLGFLFTMLGTLFLAFIATKNMNFINISIGLAFMGFGVGFTLGAPLNYLVLQTVPESEGATGLATMSLIRSMGVTISPGLLIGFVANSAKDFQPKLIATLAEGGMKMPDNVSASATMGKQFASLQNADVTTIVDQLKNVLKSFVPPQALEGIEKMRAPIENVFQATLNTGYKHMFTTVAIISVIGLLATFFLRKKVAVTEI
jgi:MFS family permease